ncbi:MAG: rhodanese-like domain-containing protein [Gammaproteobacteria bacterium]|nr:rhodanese-like domain-containing protein [Gammaproteobacteria bacterium]
MEQLSTFVMNHWVLVATLVVLSGLLLNNLVGAGLSGVASIDTQEAIRLINHQNAMVLDVRTPDEYKQGHILEALNIPVGLLDGRVTELNKHKEKPVVVNCRSGQRSARACSILKKHGFAQVHNLSGGIMAWEKANLPLTKK